MLPRILRTALQGLGLLAILGLAAGAIALVTLGDWLQVDEPPAKADYIVPLAGDEHRFLKAAALYKNGLAPMILLSNARVPPDTRIQRIEEQLGRPRVHPYRKRREILDFLGVPETATAEFGSGHISTAEEAEALKARIGERKVTVILVTSPYHTRRAKLIFERTMPQARFIMSSPPEGQLSAPWWRDQTSAIHAVTETAKLIYFWLGGVFRNAPPTPELR